MKNTIKIIGFIAIVAVIGFSMIACEGGRTVTVTADGLNLRAQPSSSSNIIKKLSKGDQLIVTGNTENGWLPVQHESSSGWVSEEYVSAVQGTERGTAQGTARGARTQPGGGSQAALSGTYIMEGTSLSVSFTNGNFFGSYGNSSESGTYTVSGNWITINIKTQRGMGVEETKAAMSTRNWTIVSADNLRDENGDIWKKTP